MIYIRIVFDVVSKYGATTERRLQIYVIAFGKSYDNVELSKISWILGSDNPVDSLTKPVLKTTSPLFSIIATNKFYCPGMGRATRK